MHSGMLEPPVRAALILGAATLVACAGGGPREPDRPAPTRTLLAIGDAPSLEIHTEPGRVSVTLPASSSRVWEVLDDVYARLEIPVNRRMPSAEEIGNTGYVARRIEGQRMNAWVDCGFDLAGPLANQYDVDITVLTHLIPRGDSTRVVTTVDAFGRPRATSGNEVHCGSREVLERRIADLTAEALGIRGWDARIEHRDESL